MYKKKSPKTSLLIKRHLIGTNMKMKNAFCNRSWGDLSLINMAHYQLIRNFNIFQHSENKKLKIKRIFFFSDFIKRVTSSPSLRKGWLLWKQLNQYNKYHRIWKICISWVRCIWDWNRLSPVQNGKKTSTFFLIKQYFFLK